MEVINAKENEASKDKAVENLNLQMNRIRKQPPVTNNQQPSLLLVANEHSGTC